MEEGLLRETHCDQSTIARTGNLRARWRQQGGASCIKVKVLIITAADRDGAHFISDEFMGKILRQV